MRAAIAPPAVAAVLALAGCGGLRAADLFIVERSGAAAGGRLTLLVNEEGRVRCNAGPTLALSDPQLVIARAIQEELHDAAAAHRVLAPRPGSTFSYRVRDPDGEVRFADNSSGQPPVLRTLALFVLQTAQRVCHLAQ